MSKLVFQSRTSKVVYIDDGHLMWTNIFEGKTYLSKKTWKDYEQAKAAYPTLSPNEDWEPAPDPL
jgi:hypothetical protein